MVNRIMKRCLTSLIVKEKQVKNTVIYHFKPGGTSISKKRHVINVGENVKKREPLLVGKYIGAATMGNSIEFPQKIRNEGTI